MPIPLRRSKQTLPQTGSTAIIYLPIDVTYEIATEPPIHWLILIFISLLGLVFVFVASLVIRGATDPVVGEGEHNMQVVRLRCLYDVI